MKQLWNLFWVFAALSLLSVGGGMAVLPEMKRMAVDQQHWVTPEQFSQIYSLGQIAPGPNLLMVLVIGYRVSGVLGAAVTGMAFFVPAGLLAFWVSRTWDRFQKSPWRLAIQQGLAPVTIGLMLAGIFAIARVAISGWIPLLMAIAVAVILLRLRVNPAILILLCGAVGWMVF